MKKKEIFEKLTVIFREEFDDENIELNELTNSEDIEDWNSLAQIDLIVSIENEFNIKFKAKEVSELRNVGEMVEMILAKV